MPTSTHGRGALGDGYWRVRSCACGGGVVPVSLVLIGGEPGIGKSRCSLQAARTSPGPTVPCCTARRRIGAPDQVARRAAGHRARAPLYPRRNVSRAHPRGDCRLKPAFIIVDSIQTVFSLRFSRRPAVSDRCAKPPPSCSLLAKGQNIPTFLVGHVTKDGVSPAPRRSSISSTRCCTSKGRSITRTASWRAVKTVRGVSELGGRDDGHRFRAVPNPSKLFLSSVRNAPRIRGVVLCRGLAPDACRDPGLVSTSTYGNARRMTSGLDQNRFAFAGGARETGGLNLVAEDVFVNVAGGIAVDEPAADLGIVAAVASSVRNRPINPRPRCLAR